MEISETTLGAVKTVVKNNTSSQVGWQLSITIKERKHAGLMVPIVCPFNLPVWAKQKLNASWRMTADYCQFTTESGEISQADVT